MGRFLKLVISFGLPFLAAFLGSLVTTPAISIWYQTLTKPSFNPPNYLFGPVWSFLYILMGVAFYLIIRNGVKNAKIKNAVYIFVLQLALNTLWSILFFGFKNPTLAFLGIIILWVIIAINIWQFYKINKTSGYLLIPYILWVSFASVLNLFIVILN